MHFQASAETVAARFELSKIEVDKGGTKCTMHIASFQASAGKAATSVAQTSMPSQMTTPSSSNSLGAPDRQHQAKITVKSIFDRQHTRVPGRKPHIHMCVN